VNNFGSLVIELLLGDPLVVEFLDLRQDGASEPGGVLAICGRLNIRAHWRRCKRLDFFLHASLHSLKHGASTSKDDVLKQVLLDVVLTLHYRVVGVLVNTIDLHGVGLHRGHEEHLRALQALLTQRDLLPTG